MQYGRAVSGIGGVQKNRQGDDFRPQHEGVRLCRHEEHPACQREDQGKVSE